MGETDTVVLRVPQSRFMYVLLAEFFGVALFGVAASVYIVSLIVSSRAFGDSWLYLIVLVIMSSSARFIWLGGGLLKRRQTVGIEGDRLVVRTRGMLGRGQAAVRDLEELRGRQFEIRTFSKGSSSAKPSHIGERLVVLDDQGRVLVECGAALPEDEMLVACESLNRLVATWMAAHPAVDDGGSTLGAGAIRPKREPYVYADTLKRARRIALGFVWFPVALLFMLVFFGATLAPPQDPDAAVLGGLMAFGAVMLAIGPYRHGRRRRCAESPGALLIISVMDAVFGNLSLLAGYIASILYSSLWPYLFMMAGVVAVWLYLFPREAAWRLWEKHASVSSG